MEHKPGLPHEAADFDRARATLGSLRSAMGHRLVGKKDLVDGILAAILCDGHVLLEGVPGLAKTLAVRAFSAAARLEYRRIQFTPDLLPGDITGTLFYDAPGGRFVPRQGPVFANVVLADEINRAPAKVQSALLEAMEERQVTMGNQSLPLPSPFFVLATQNPIEHEGTFKLPEAQLDRFMLKLLADYPSEDEELLIMKSNADRSSSASTALSGIDPVVGPEDIQALRLTTQAVRFDDDAAAYAVALVRATRPTGPEPANHVLREARRLIEFGASPRASIALFRAARAAALMDGRDYVMPQDIKHMAPAVFRHRIVASYAAEAERISVDAIIKGILQAVAVP